MPGSPDNNSALPGKAKFEDSLHQLVSAPQPENEKEEYNQSQPQPKILLEPETQNREERLRQARNRQLGLIRAVAATLLASASSTTLISALLVIFVQGWVPVALLVISALTGVMMALGYWLARTNSSPRRTSLASYQVLLSTLVAMSLATLLVGSNSSMPAAFMIIPVLSGILGQNRQGIVVLSLLAAGLLGLLYTLENLVQLYQAPLSLTAYPLIVVFMWLLVLVVIGACVTVFTTRLRGATAYAEEQTLKLNQALATLQHTFELSADLSQALSQVTAELNATAQQQSSSTQQQLAAVNQVSSSLQELSETADQVASSAVAVAELADQALKVASQVREASLLTEQTSIQGNQAVTEVLESVEEVRNRIELLGQRLLNLTEQTYQVATINDLIEEIADETHLLALNASIEAAGHPHMTSASVSVSVSTSDEGVRNSARSEAANFQGERFGVIAREVKGLSDRSREATEEVRGAITQMQGATAAAVLVAEEGKKQTAAALNRAQVAGAVIENLDKVIVSSATYAEEIVKAVEEVKMRCDEISLASNQQGSANQQIVQTMQGVAELTQLSVSMVGQLAQTANRINSYVIQLNALLVGDSRLSSHFSISNLAQAYH